MSAEQGPVTSRWQGRQVWLAARNVETDAALDVRWERDSGFHRLTSPRPAYPMTLDQVRRYYEPRGPRSFPFAIRALKADRLIGYIGLWIESWISREAWVGIGLGDRGDWGQGYGTEALQLILRYGFTELHLHRVSLTVLAANPRAIRSYEKCGFVREGEVRDAARYDGQYYDEVVMGLLRDEWRGITPDA